MAFLFCSPVTPAWLRFVLKNTLIMMLLLMVKQYLLWSHWRDLLILIISERLAIVGGNLMMGEGKTKGDGEVCINFGCTGCPKKTEFCWSHHAPIQTLVQLHAPLGLENVFFVRSFITKTKQDQALPRYFNGEIWPNSTQF